MSLLYNLVFTILIGECSVLTVFLLPLPLSMRKNALKFLSTNPLVQQVLYMVRISFIGVGLLMLDAWRVVYAESAHSGHDEDSMESMGKKAKAAHYAPGYEPHARLWRAQRNLYLTGFTLFLGIVLYRFFGTLLELQQHEDKAAAVKKQAEGARKEYDRMLDEVKKKDDKIREMLEKEETLVAQNKTFKADFEAMKRQSENLSKAYDDLSTLHNELEKKTRGSGGGKAD
ncbi:B-cell receptor-associated protein 31-like-domain-containing protein [Hyaloraphidium curvatum]|nr:B-cell receptor-associated protein 31-like-domain-containing protein [Hyaloraphidium curvatum]